MWPRFRLTKEESKYNSKYEEPGKSKMPVLRRIYAGELNITTTIRQDSETFQISRRSRLFGITASGDIYAMKIKISDISGEQYTTDYIAMSNLILGGTAFDPRSNEIFNPLFNITPGISTGLVSGYYTWAPFIFEPSLVMAPNQTVTVDAQPINPEQEGPLHVDLCFHVWEFPGFPGSPL